MFAVRKHPEPNHVCGLLPAYLSGAATENEQVEFEAHLAECERCRTDVESDAGEATFWQAASHALDSNADPTGSITPFRCNTSVGDLLGENLSGVPTSSLDLQTIEHELAQWLDPCSTDSSNDCYGDNQCLGRMGTYHIRGVVGWGGMGIVLRAYDPQLNRSVAIKTITKQLFGGLAKDRLLREAKAAASIVHDHVVPILAIDTWRETPYIVMPFIEGGTLKETVASGTLSVRDTLKICDQIAAGLLALHENSLVHRDIKPTNILMERGFERVRISDFGLARHIDDNTLTNINTVAGTPAFMSPEQARGLSVDAKTDIFSLGSLLYWMLTQTYPFADSGSYGTILSIVNDTPIPPGQRNANVPSCVDRLVSLLMQKDPQQRPDAWHAKELIKSCFDYLQTNDLRKLPESLRGHRNRIISNWGLVICSFCLLGLLIVAFKFIASPTPNTTTTTTTVLATPTQTETDGTSGSIVQQSRFGELDDLDRSNLRSDLQNEQNLTYWLRRLAYLPAGEIPPESIPYIESLTNHNDVGLRELALVILSKNPFEVVIPYEEPSSDNQNPFEVID